MDVGKVRKQYSVLILSVILSEVSQIRFDEAGMTGGRTQTLRTRSCGAQGGHGWSCERWFSAGDADKDSQRQNEPGAV